MLHKSRLTGMTEAASHRPGSQCSAAAPHVVALSRRPRVSTRVASVQTKQLPAKEVLNLHALTCPWREQTQAGFTSSAAVVDSYQAFLTLLERCTTAPPPVHKAGSAGRSPSASPALASQEEAVDAVQDIEISESCAIAHPGSECCSHITMHRDGKLHTIVINQTTTVRQKGQGGMKTVEMEELGLRAAAEKLTEVANSLSETSTPEKVKHHRQAITELLRDGEVKEVQVLTNTYGHPTYRVRLEYPEGDHRRQRPHESVWAMVKPCIEGNAEGWHRAEVEAVAYHMSLLLGMNYVPPTVFRPRLELNWQCQKAVLMYWAHHGCDLKEVPKEQWGRPFEAVLSDARVLDVLIQNSDRHHGHFMWAEHWDHGKGDSPVRDGWRGKKMPVFIDHAAGFRPDAMVTMQHDNAFGTGATVRIAARTFLRLRCLHRAALATAVGDLLTPAEVDQVMRRKEDILKYFDQLIAERGYDNVVIEVGSYAS